LLVVLFVALTGVILTNKRSPTHALDRATSGIGL